MFGGIAAELNEISYTTSGLISMDLNEEQQLVEDAKTDSASFARLYDLYFPKIYAYTSSKINNKNDVEDVVSETFMKALENISGYEYRGVPFAAWLFTIARNNINNYYVKSGRSKHHELEEGRYIVDDEKQKSPKKNAEQEELSQKVKEVLKDLPERDINVIQLKFFSQLSNREIMHVTGLSESNVAVIIYRTLKKIKPDLKYFV